MRALIIGTEAKEKIAALIKFAEEHKYDSGYLKLVLSEEAPAPGNLEVYNCYLDDGYKCVYTVEEQPEPLGWCHHLSVSVDDPEKVPSVPAVELLMKEFGINRKLKDENVYVWIEENIRPRAVNILAKK